MPTPPPPPPPPLKGVETLSWPISATLHEVRVSGRRQTVLVLGDQHRSLRGACAPRACVKPKCMDLVALIRALAARAQLSNTALDVYLEMQLGMSLAFVDRHWRPAVEPFLARLRQRLTEWLHVDALFGRHPGYLYEVAMAFRRETFLSPKTPGPRPPEGEGAEAPELPRAWVRFHAADARADPLLEALRVPLRSFNVVRSIVSPSKPTTPAQEICEAYGTRERLRAAMIALCFDADPLEYFRRNHPSVHERLTSAAPSRPAYRSTMSALDLALAPSRAFHSVGDRRAQALIRHVCGAGAAASSAKAELPPTAYPTLHISVEETLRVMDVYLLSTLLARLGKAPRDSVAVVFVGNAHADNYRRFLELLSRKKRSGPPSKPKKSSWRRLFEVPRCVPVEKRGPEAARRSRERGKRVPVGRVDA